MSAAQSLQKAIFTRLSTDATLTALTGPDAIHDRLVTRREAPTILIASIDSRDRSTASEAGEEHLVTLKVMTGEGGHAAAQAIAARIRALLHDAPLTLTGFTLVSLLHRSTVTRREAKERGHVAEMVFRAATE